MENVARVGRKFELDQIQANSSQVGGQTIPNSIEVVNLAELAWVGSTVWSGAITAALLHAVSPG